MRDRKASDFVVPVEGIGSFTFGKRTLRDDIAIAAEYSRLTEGVETPTEWLAFISGCVSALTVLTVSAPDGWVLDEIDPLSEDGYASIVKVHSALRSAEIRFRGGVKPAQVGAGDGGNNPVLVPPPVQPAAE